MTTATAKTTTRMERLLALANHPNTPEHERAVAQQFLERLRAKQADGAARHRRDTTWYGAKYDHTGTLTTADIARLIREEIKAIRKVGKKTADAGPADGALVLADPIGDAPATIKISVRVPYYGAIRIRVSGVPREWGWIYGPDKWGSVRWHHTDAMEALFVELSTLMNAYNHDRSDILTDYFDKRFTGSVDTDWREDSR